MTGERIGNLLVWGDGALWRYLPLVPVPQRSEAGRAMVTVIETGGMVMLTVGARLGAEEADLAQARAALATRAAAGDPRTVDLRPAEVQVDAASLVLRAADGAETDLATARPSPLPPHPAALSAMVQGDQAAAVKAALPAGRLIVRYAVTLPGLRRATAELAGTWDGRPLGAALERGDLSLSTRADAGASPDLVRRAVDRVMAQAARSPPATAGPLALSVTETEAVSEALRLEAGLADWIN